MSKRYNFPEWLNKSKFDQYQLEQIKEEIKSGLESGIDTSHNNLCFSLVNSLFLTFSFLHRDIF